MGLEQRSIDPLIERRCAECWIQLTESELRASIEAGGRFLCSVHAAEEAPLEDTSEDEVG